MWQKIYDGYMGDVRFEYHGKSVGREIRFHSGLHDSFGYFKNNSLIRHSNHIDYPSGITYFLKLEFRELVTHTHEWSTKQFESQLRNSDINFKIPEYIISGVRIYSWARDGKAFRNRNQPNLIRYSSEKRHFEETWDYDENGKYYCKMQKEILKPMPKFNQIIFPVYD